jgi:hypothetical protein
MDGLVSHMWALRGTHVGKHILYITVPHMVLSEHRGYTPNPMVYHENRESTKPQAAMLIGKIMTHHSHSKQYIIIKGICLCTPDFLLPLLTLNQNHINNSLDHDYIAMFVGIIHSWTNPPGTFRVWVVYL